MIYIKIILVTEIIERDLSGANLHKLIILSLVLSSLSLKKM